MTRITRLELNGFKTFAGRTHFAFDDGITAIVGPNGSGKSNLADAVRWILGEQRSAALRARTGADLIFSGTERRARTGLAEGFLTIDNEAGLLPIDFAEVVIGRRAYRTGESEYLINGSRVRLRDVQELLSHAGVGTSTYTVIGQGLVDAALALRADERRRLFEDAAGLGAYQGKRQEALRRLGQTSEHLTRIHDILAELEPRLRRLRRQAERAAEHQELADTLERLLRQLYGYRWGQVVQALSTARRHVQEQGAAAAEAAAVVEQMEQEIDTLRQRQNALRETLAASRRVRVELREEMERLRREQAVADERASGFERQRRGLLDELESLERERAESRQQLDESQSRGATLEQELAAATERLDGALARLKDAVSERAALRLQLEEARRTLGRITAQQGERVQERQTLDERVARVAGELADHQGALGPLQVQLDEQNEERERLTEALDQLEREQEATGQARRALLTRREEASAAVAAARRALHEVERAQTALETRRSILERLREEGANYEEGVRALLAERKRFGSTLVAPVADLLQVPEAHGAAVAAALRESLHAMVVTEGWERVRAWLHEEERGRVTLLPLADLVRDRATPPPEGDGVIGPAAALVGGDEPRLLAHLLGRWLVVEDWPTLQRLAASAGEWNLVTRDGQVRLADGAVIAGRGEGRSSSLLAQSREWAALPNQQRRVEADRAGAERAVSEAEEASRAIEEELIAIDATLAEQGQTQSRLVGGLERTRRAVEKMEQEREWRASLARKLEGEQQSLGGRRSALEEELAALQIALERSREQVATLERELEAAHPGSLREAVERARTGVAVREEQLAGWRRGLATLEESLARLNRRHEQRAADLVALESEAESLGGRSASVDAAVAAVDSRLGAAAAVAEPQEQEMAANETRLAELESQQQGRRRQQHAADERRHTARLALQSAEERMAHLREQIETELGMVEVADADGMVHQSLLPLDELVTSLPRVSVLPDGLENDVRRLRRRIAYLGGINPEAPAEYAELAERFDFLTEQSADLDRATGDLERIVAELDEIMQSRFIETFEGIERAFEDYFARLFGGGRARLELTDPEDINQTGVEIIARPPGKRAQSIALLSGGERALTAAALIFAILKVSPAPFCVLDEVDAMLDEANIGRFRGMLQELAQKTQFIVITHNRGTIEAASAIYGISQSDPGISEVISLQLDEAVVAAKH